MGQGTTFKAMFPAIEAPSEGHSEKPSASARPDVGVTVLVVDDDETVRALARRMLERSECKVITADDGRQAIDIFRRQSGGIDVVLLDMTMPHLSGEETFRELRRIRPEISVVLSSGYNQQEAIGRFTGKGLAGFVQKPYGPAELIPVIQRAVSQSRAAVQTDSNEKKATRKEISRKGDETILIVDDEEVVRTSLGLLLKRAGYTVLAAGDGPEAVELYRNAHEEIAMVIIDRRMHPLSGEETLSQLKAIAPEVKAVLCSGDEMAVRTSGSELGDALAILPKPYAMEDFWRVIRHLLDDDSGQESSVVQSQD